MGLLHVAPVACGQRVLEAVRDDACLDGQLQVEVLPPVDELLGVDADLLQQVLEHPGNEEEVVHLWVNTEESRRCSSYVKPSPLGLKVRGCFM